MKCPKCNNGIAVGAKFCNHCGYKFKVCPKCGKTDFPPEAVYCSDCGKKLEGGEDDGNSRKKNREKTVWIILLSLAAILALVLGIYIPKHNEQKVWEKSVTRNTLEAYEQYIAKYPDGKHAAFAMQKIEMEEAWQNALEEKTEKKYKEFIAKYPNSPYNEDANSNIQKIEMEEAWQKALEEATETGYKKFIAEYPQSPYNGDANTKIADIQKKTKLLSEQQKRRQLLLEQKKTQKKSFTETVNGISFGMVAVKGGTFSMGSPANEKDRDDDEKQHQVTVSDFFIGKTEVTQALWQTVMGNNPSRFKGDNRPVEQVSRDDCQKFIKALNKLTGKHYRLPTEAQWEYAARGGCISNGYIYAGSNNIDVVAWHSYNSGGETHPAGQKRPNELGLYDMSGNVSEWCQDWYGSYISRSQIDPTGSVSGYFRVHRGGTWGDSAEDCRTANRANGGLSQLGGLGFRLVLFP